VIGRVVAADQELTVSRRRHWPSSRRITPRRLGMRVATLVLRVAVTRQPPEDDDMIERASRTARSGWAPWAIGAVLSLGCAAWLLLRRRRTARDRAEEYEAWWRHREEIRASGRRRPVANGHPEPPELFV
jgi:hypothetical protein